MSSGKLLQQAVGLMMVTLLLIGCSIDQTRPVTKPPPSIIRTPIRTPTPQIIIHVVQKGETLSSIASKYGVTVAELVAWNDIENPNLIQVGQVLIIRPGAEGIVRPTSTLPFSNISPRPVPCRCDGNFYNCYDFPTQAAAQACYNYCLSVVGFDVHWLDDDRDGIACEWNP